MEAKLTGDENSIVLDRQPGIVAYWSHTDQYAINFAVEGTIDSVHSGLVEDLDEKYRKPGLKVLVSGRLYKTPDLPPPMLGGQEIFALEVSELSIAE